MSNTVHSLWRLEHTRLADQWPGARRGGSITVGALQQRELYDPPGMGSTGYWFRGYGTGDPVARGSARPGRRHTEPRYVQNCTIPRGNATNGVLNVGRYYEPQLLANGKVSSLGLEQRCPLQRECTTVPWNLDQYGSAEHRAVPHRTLLPNAGAGAAATKHGSLTA